jgi:DNA-binding SARP family transcriptional activator
MEFVLLGGIAVFVEDCALDLGLVRQRCVLAALAMDADRVVPVDRLIERVWGDGPPLRARATLLNYLSRLRLPLAGEARVVRRPGGYSLEVERSTIHLLRFRDLRAQFRGDARQAAALLRQALGLWRGEALTGIEGEWAAAERDRLHQQLLDTERDLTDAVLRLGHGEDLVASLTAHATQWPLDERVAAQLILALHRAGRTADAHVSGALRAVRMSRTCHVLFGLSGLARGSPGSAFLRTHRRMKRHRERRRRLRAAAVPEPMAVGRNLAAQPKAARIGLAGRSSCTEVAAVSRMDWTG